MRLPKKHHFVLTRTVALAACGSLMVLATGCGVDFGPGPTGGDVVDGNVGGGGVLGEPNDRFTQSIAALFDGSGKARLQGTVEAIGDLDVYSLGALEMGDRVTVDATTPGSALDVSIALFDGLERLVLANDDKNSGLSPLDAVADFVIRHAVAEYYLVVTHSAFAGSSRFTGSYAVEVSVTAGASVPEPMQQVLLLDFDGATVDSPVLGRLDLDPFDAADISAMYRGQTQAIKDQIRATFEQNFRRFDVMIVTTDDHPPPAGVGFSSIYFGGFNSDIFGIAETVDVYNVDCCDDAIIHTETFSPSIFLSAPSAVEMGIAIGNIGSHEAGHLLGLNHVSDDRALMDDQSAVDVFLDDQEFMEAVLSSDIMLIGTQDAALLLLETVGAAVLQPFTLTLTARDWNRSGLMRP